MKKLSIVFALFGLFGQPSVQAKDFVGSSSASLGGGGGAVFEPMDSLYLNPALVGSDGKIYVGSGFSSGTFVKGVFRETYSAVSSDGAAKNAFPGGLGFKYHRLRYRGELIKEKEYSGAISLKLGGKFRAGLSYTHIQGSGEKGTEYRTHNGDLGVFYAPTSKIGISLVGENFLEFDKDVPDPLKRLGRLRLGLAANIQNILKIRWDMAHPLAKPGSSFRLAHSGGLSFLLRGAFALNGGVILDDIREQRWWTGGLVWNGPRLKLGYSYQTEVRENIDQRHLVDLWLDL